MSHARSYSLPVNVLLDQKSEKKKHRGLLRRLAKAFPGRKKKKHGVSASNFDDYGSGSDSLDLNDSPLTPSTSVDSLDVINPSNYLGKDDIGLQTEGPPPLLSVEILREVKPILQCLQADNKNSQERVCTRYKFWQTKGYTGSLWAQMLQEWQLLHEHHITQAKELDNILTSLEWVSTT